MTKPEERMVPNDFSWKSAPYWVGKEKTTVVAQTFLSVLFA